MPAAGPRRRRVRQSRARPPGNDAGRRRRGRRPAPDALVDPDAARRRRRRSCPGDGHATGRRGLPQVPGVRAVITRKTKLKLLAFAALARARHVLPGLQLRRPGPAAPGQRLRGGRRLRATPAASSSTPRSPTAASRVGRVSDMQLVDDGVRVDAHHRPGHRPDPGRHRRGRRHPQRGRRAVRRPAARRPTRARSSRTARSSRRTAPASRCPSSSCCSTSTSLVGSIDQENLRIVVEELGKAFAGAGRRPRPADRQRRPAARPRRGVAAADPAADHRRADRARDPGGQPVGDPAVGGGPAHVHRHARRDRPRPARPRGQRAGRGGAAASSWSRTPGRGWARWCATSTSSTGCTIPRLDGVEQMLVTYPDVVSGGFTVVRRDADGRDALALRLRAQRRRPALLHHRATSRARSCRARAPSRTSTSTASGATWSTASTRTRATATTRTAPTSAASRTSAAPAGTRSSRPAAARPPCRIPRAARDRRQVLGRLLLGQPVRLHRRVTGGMPPAHTDHRTGRIARVTSEARARLGTRRRPWPRPSPDGRDHRRTCGGSRRRPAPTTEPTTEASRRRRGRRAAPARHGRGSDDDGAPARAAGSPSRSCRRSLLLLALLLAATAYLWFTRPGAVRGAHRRLRGGAAGRAFRRRRPDLLRPPDPRRRHRADPPGHHR